MYLCDNLIAFFRHRSWSWSWSFADVPPILNSFFPPLLFNLPPFTHLPLRIIRFAHSSPTIYTCRARRKQDYLKAKVHIPQSD